MNKTTKTTQTYSTPDMMDGLTLDRRMAKRTRKAPKSVLKLAIETATMLVGQGRCVEQACEMTARCASLTDNDHRTLLSYMRTR